MFSAANAADDPQLNAARERVKRLESLWNSGAVSKTELAQAKDEVADAEDAALLRGAVVTSDLTDAQADEMVEAAARRLERRKLALEKAQKMVDEGLATQASLIPLRQELDYAREQSDLAQDRARVTRELAAAARVELLLEETLATAPERASEAGERYDGSGIFTPNTFARIESAYQGRFGKPLPVSAMGETAVHRALGFDHTGRVDVALNPDQPEGVWLRSYLSENRIPYFAFRQAVPGKATGAHIHLGPQSTHLAHGG
ncbi:MAG: hypothetical protein JO323_05595 [Acidobacteriia bacterium]|nr:hypothetical protein [Terriglobia bacterium]